ncbi:Uncharacterised protein [Legionella wadsworthii]|uniref:RasGEF domain n=1 Tax=Legionella wadsworthii TaxID=28088 RepID=A0A378LV47_9GAMM|nr:hypothetical protein [Legionella wadsworthii]STY31248.1 Uncharacterised protein [Legionella wadsworthii]
MTQKVTLFRESYFKNLIEKQQFLTHPHAASVWDDMVTHKDTRKEMKKDPNFKVFSSYMESRFAHEHAKLLDAKLRGGPAADRADRVTAKLQEKGTFEECVENQKQLIQEIQEDINKQTTQEDKIKAIRRWKDAAVLLWKREHRDGYSLVREALEPVAKKLKKQANKDTIAVDHLEIRKIVKFYITEDIKKHDSQSAQINAFHRWMETALILRKRHDNPEGYLLVCDTLKALDKKLKVTKNKAFHPYLKLYQQLLKTDSELDAALIDYKFRAKYAALSVQDFSNSKGLECFEKASPNLKLLLNYRTSLHERLIKDIKYAQGEDKINEFCRWTDILIELKNRHNYDLLVYLGTYLQTIDQVTQQKGFPQSYLEKYNQIVKEASPSGLRERMNQDDSPYKITSIFYISRKLILLDGNIESTKMRLDQATAEEKESLRQSFTTLSGERYSTVEPIHHEIKSSEKYMMGSSTTPKHLVTKYAEVEEAYQNQHKAILAIRPS